MDEQLRQGTLLPASFFFLLPSAPSSRISSFPRRQLFSHVSSSNPGATSAGSAVSTTATSAPQEAEVPKVSPVPDTAHPPLLFKFTPQIKSLIDPSLDSLPHGTDAWAVHTGKASVSPLRACFAQPGRESFAFGDEVVPEGEKAGDGQGGGRLWTW